MSRVLIAVVCVIAMAGCAKQGAAPPPGAPPAGASASPVNRFLAYEHTIGIETEGDKVAAVFAAAQQACLDAVEDACAILDARVSGGDGASAQMRFRAKAAGIRKVIDVVTAQGKVSAQSTTAEDLEGPITDTAKKIAMLTSYRGQLEGLRARPNTDLDSLMRLTRELADVQSQIESLAGSQAGLELRVQTEILNVSIESFASQSFWRPTADALSSFAGNLSEAVAAVITLIAFALPFGALLVLCIWMFGMWRRRKRS